MNRKPVLMLIFLLAVAVLSGCVEIDNGNRAEEQEGGAVQSPQAKYLAIAMKDPEVQSLLEGKDYTLTSVSATNENAILSLKIEGKFYKITTDLNNETSIIEEQFTGNP